VTTNDPLSEAGPEVESTVWVSGTIVTFLNKLVLPPLWIGLNLGLLAWAYSVSDGISIAPDFRWLAALFVAATVFMLWFSVKLQRVGYAGRVLVVTNYWREARIPFEHVAAVEPVWWYRRRLVRIRFNTRTPFGATIFYLPRWGPMRFVMKPPDEELRNIIF